jgi:hypothetical protein
VVSGELEVTAEEWEINIKIDLRQSVMVMLIGMKVAQGWIQWQILVVLLNVRGLIWGS